MRHPNPRVIARVLFLFFAVSIFAAYFCYRTRPFQLPPNAYCDGEQMSFVSYENGAPSTVGIRFRCSLVPLLRSLGLSDAFHYPRMPYRQLETRLGSAHPSTNFFLSNSKEDVVYVTYSSSNHFMEARASLSALRRMTPNRIIFYDLGLKSSELVELAAVCNLEIRRLNFDRYPPFTRRLKGYHFKPILIAEVFSSLEAFWIMDTNVYFLGNGSTFHSNVSSGGLQPVTLGHYSSHTIYAATYKSTYPYLPIGEELAKRRWMLDANTMFIQRSDFAREAVKWNLLCALTEECMSPKGAQLSCSFKKDRHKEFAHCHRYDQSAINLIVTSLLGRDNLLPAGVNEREDFINFTAVHRGRNEPGPLRIPCDERLSDLYP